MKPYKWVVEWSQQQNTFHLATLTDAVLTNRKLMLSNRPNQYAIVGFARTYDAAKRMAESFQEQQKKLSHESITR